MKRALLILSLLALPLGCDDAPPPAPGTDEKLPTGLLSDSDLPVVADYEDEADTSISADNYKAELEKLEKEVESTN